LFPEFAHAAAHFNGRIRRILFYLLELYGHQRNALTDVVVTLPMRCRSCCWASINLPLTPPNISRQAIRNQDEGKLECFGKDAKPGAGHLHTCGPECNEDVLAESPWHN
jgi:hypothetical protein